jgi:hypothetical protein
MISRITMVLTTVIMSMTFPSEAMSASVCSIRRPAIFQDIDFPSCVRQVAQWECRGSPTYSQMDTCFTREARRIYQEAGRRMPDYFSKPRCDGADDTFGWACWLPGEAKGAEEWCVREDETTVINYKGAPPNEVGEKDTNCPIGRCHCGFQKAGPTR